MATIQEKFPGLPSADIRAIPTAVTFVGDLVAGKFVFNSLLDFYETSANDVLVLDGLELAADIDQLEFSRAIVAPFKVQLFRKQSHSPIIQQPFVFSAFNQGHNFSANWSPSMLGDNGHEMIQISLKGELTQTAPLVGLAEVKIFASAMVYLIPKGVIK